MNKIYYKSLDDLLLDKNNPRIHQKISANISQIELAVFIYNNFGISDLVESIKKNGYFAVEPMVVIPEGDKYIVVEGNRRLTTIKILCQEEYRNKAISLGRREDFLADNSIIEKLNIIPVVIAKDRSSVNAYLGVRHLGGVIRWEPLAQSKYVYNQIVSSTIADKDKTINIAITDFIEETSNKKLDVYNQFYKYCIYQQMNTIIDERKIKNTLLENKFSLLEVAFGKYGKSNIANYIGIESYSQLDPGGHENIIPDDKEEQTANLIKWVFTENPPIKESRQINEYLKKILANPVSTKAFEETGDKEAALLLSDTYENIIKNACVTIHGSLTHIQNNWANTKVENRENLKEIYKVNVIEKVVKTNKTVDIE